MTQRALPLCLCSQPDACLAACVDSEILTLWMDHTETSTPARAQLDVMLAEHLADKFNAEPAGSGDDVRKNSKAMAKLIKQARSRLQLRNRRT